LNNFPPDADEARARAWLAVPQMGRAVARGLLTPAHGRAWAYVIALNLHRYDPPDDPSDMIRTAEGLRHAALEHAHFVSAGAYTSPAWAPGSQIWQAAQPFRDRLDAEAKAHRARHRDPRRAVARAAFEAIHRHGTEREVRVAALREADPDALDIPADTELVPLFWEAPE